MTYTLTYLDRPIWRNRTGHIVHQGGCRRIGATAVEWRWAAERSDRDIRRTVEQTPWLRWCTDCDPLREETP